MRHVRVAALAPLYFVQGMPFGFQTKALKLHLTSEGVSLTAVSLAGLLALPWLLKPLVAPYVDRLGTRHQWILPLTGALVVAQLAAAQVDPSAHLAQLMGLLLVMNVFTAAQDVAVDGLAVDVLRGADVGAGNGVQVAGYKVGMLVGGSALIVLLADWGSVFLVMAALTACGLALHLALWRRSVGGGEAREKPASLRQVLHALLAAARTPSGLLFLGFVGTYKLGESISDELWKPYLQRGVGLSKTTVALWDSTWGMGFSIAGSALGGWLASRVGPLRAVALTAVSRLVPAVAYLLCVLTTPGHDALIAANCVEELTGGALTPAMFSLMMTRVDHRIGATHFTVLAAVEVAGKAPGGLLAGALADKAGFATAFGVALGLTTLTLLWLRPVGRSVHQPTT